MTCTPDQWQVKVILVSVLTWSGGIVFYAPTPDGIPEALHMTACAFSRISISSYIWKEPLPPSVMIPFDEDFSEDTFLEDVKACPEST